MNEGAVFAASQRLVRAELACDDAFYDTMFFIGVVGGNQKVIDEARYGLAGRIAEDRFRTLAPVDDAAIRRRRDDGVRRLVQQQLVQPHQHSAMVERERANRPRSPL